MFLQTSKFHAEVRQSWPRWLATLQHGWGEKGDHFVLQGGLTTKQK